MLNLSSLGRLCSIASIAGAMTLATACGADRRAESQAPAATTPTSKPAVAQKTSSTAERNSARATASTRPSHAHATHPSTKADKHSRPQRGHTQRRGKPSTTTPAARPPIPAGARATEKSAPRPSGLSRADRAALAKPAGRCPADTRKHHLQGRQVCAPTANAPYIRDIFAIGAPCDATMQPIFAERHRRCVHGKIVAD